MSLATERADFVAVLKDIVNSDWQTSERDDVYFCRFCHKSERETVRGFLINHYDSCPAYLAKKVLEKHGIQR